ncbi:MAG: M23 family metallopeptidase [Rhizobiaceae bacterium]
MSRTGFRHASVFGRRSEPHTVIIAHGDNIRHFTVRPWLVTLLGSALAAIAVGYLLATTYLVLRDDLLGATVARQARMQQAYEDRISALRAQLDRITSRQLLDQQLMESKVSELLDRQAVLSARHGIISPLLDGAKGDRLGDKVPVPKPRPDDRAEASVDDVSALAYAGTDPITTGAIFSRILSSDNAAGKETAADRADRVFVAINKSLRSIEIGQVKKIRSLTEDAYQTADTISETLSNAGLNVGVDFDKAATGGPLITIDPSRFDSEVEQLDEALKTLEMVKTNAKMLPIVDPLPGHKVTSKFGMRRDPLLGRRAMHSGMDIRAPLGFPVKATGAGTVVSAGWNGGYGRMVEIDHGNGISTRYAHMSRIRVKEGQKVVAGDIVGNVGSSGRSTGPHLHYEVRRGDRPINPRRFIAVGRALSKLL